MKRFLFVIAATGLTMTMVLGFQNCSQQGFDNNSSSVKAGNTNSASGTPQTQPTPLSFSVEDSSVGNGTVITRLTQVIRSGGVGLRGCTALMSAYNTNCLSESDFILITSANAWGPNSYDSVTNTYSVDMDVSTRGFPFQTYFTRYILADGTRKEITFTPRLVSSGLKWVQTKFKSCIGPTPPPAPIGSACSVAGETVTNECGTATCQ